MITLMLSLAFGGFVGWLASLVTFRDTPRGRVSDIAIGAVGAAGGALVFGRESSAALLHPDSLFMACVGAFVLLGIAHLLLPDYSP